MEKIPPAIPIYSSNATLKRLSRINAYRQIAIERDKSIYELVLIREFSYVLAPEAALICNQNVGEGVLKEEYVIMMLLAAEIAEQGEAYPTEKH